MSALLIFHDEETLEAIMIAVKSHSRGGKPIIGTFQGSRCLVYVDIAASQPTMAALDAMQAGARMASQIQ
jgi:hypothetical protein